MIQFVVWHQQQWLGTASTWIEAIMIWERWSAEARMNSRTSPDARHQRIEERRGPHPRWRDRRWLDDVCAQGVDKRIQTE